MQTEIVRTSGRKKWWIAGIVAAVVLVAGVNVAVLQSRKQQEAAGLQFTSLTEQTLRNTKLVSGRVVPGGMESLYADATKGKVKEIFVKAGDAVEKGQKLFAYENSDLDAQLKQLALDEKLAKLQAQQTDAKVNDAAEALQEAKDAGAADSVLQPLQAQLDELKLAQTTNELGREKTQLQRKQLEQKQAELIVYSTLAGTVQKVDESAGTSVQPKVLLQIAANEPYRIEGVLNELQKAQIQPGQVVTLTSKAVANKTWTGKITEVEAYPAGDAAAQEAAAATGQDTQKISYYNYKAALDAQDGLAPGYHVSLQVDITAQKIQAVPRDSIVEEDGASYVYVKEDGKLKKQKVKTGLGDGEWIEIEEGLTAEQSVLKKPTDQVYEGMEVKGA